VDGTDLGFCVLVGFLISGFGSLPSLTLPYTFMAWWWSSE